MFLYVITIQFIFKIFVIRNHDPMKVLHLFV